MTGSKAMMSGLIAMLMVACSPVAEHGSVGAAPPVTRLDTSPAQGVVEPVSRIEGLTLEVRPLPDGAEALDVWLGAIAGADRSVDIKTFIFRADPVGRVFEDALLSAADRGVEVRILLDDFFHRWEGGDLSRLDAHPNIAVRLFNPHSRALPAPLGFVAEFPRVNRRMHNKMMIVDDSRAIVGGRNIADEYFLKDPETYFTDFDLWIEGRDVGRFSTIFEAYWTDDLSIPASRTGRARGGGRVQISTGSGRFRDDAPPSVTSVQARAPLFRTEATVHTDPPDRIRGAPQTATGEVERAFLSGLAAARSEVLIVTPYLIPETHGAQLLEDLAERGVRVTILTNSHGSTNHPSVHAGYMRYRRGLLEAGVRIHEFRGGAVREFRGKEGEHRASVVMHTKLAVIDRRTSLIGSPNFDPRSLQQNTEILMRLEDPMLAGWLADRYMRVAERYAFQLTVGASGEEEWVYRDGETLKRRTREPLGSAMDSAVTTFFRLFPFDQYL